MRCQCGKQGDRQGADFRGQIGGTRATLAKLSAEVARNVRDAIVTAARAHSTAGGVVRLSNETICFSARA
jgi:hypothetical protein